MKTLFMLALSVLISLQFGCQEKWSPILITLIKMQIREFTGLYPTYRRRKLNWNPKFIADDKLYAEVKLYKEVNGVKIESTPDSFHSNEVRIKIYKSFDSLEKAGYLMKKGEEE